MPFYLWHQLVQAIPTILQLKGFQKKKKKRKEKEKEKKTKKEKKNRPNIRRMPGYHTLLPDPNIQSNTSERAENERQKKLRIILKRLD